MSQITTSLEQTLAYLKQGKVVAIPTETVYGLAADASNEQAIKTIFQLKNRPIDHPLIMHIAEGWDLSRWVDPIPTHVHLLIEEFWPGPLTLVMHSKPEKVSPLITGGQATVAIRCPNHPMTQFILKQFGLPLVAPSANPFSKISPTTAEHVQQSFAKEELLILDGGRCAVGIESTIVLIEPSSYQILRHGSVSEADLSRVLPTMAVNKPSSVRVPGKLENHYQPEKTLYRFVTTEAIQAFCRQANALVYIISFGDMQPEAPHLYYQLPSSPDEAAFELYYQLRWADQSSADVIAIELPPDQERWQGIKERICKASVQV